MIKDKLASSYCVFVDTCRLEQAHDLPPDRGEITLGHYPSCILFKYSLNILVMSGMLDASTEPHYSLYSQSLPLTILTISSNPFQPKCPKPPTNPVNSFFTLSWSMIYCALSTLADSSIRMISTQPGQPSLVVKSTRVKGV